MVAQQVALVVNRDIKMKTVPIISMKKICKSFPLEVGGEQQVLFDITFAIKSGEFVAIMGPSGS